MSQEFSDTKDKWLSWDCSHLDENQLKKFIQEIANRVYQLSISTTDDDEIKPEEMIENILKWWTIPKEFSDILSKHWIDINKLESELHCSFKRYLSIWWWENQKSWKNPKAVKIMLQAYYQSIHLSLQDTLLNFDKMAYNLDFDSMKLKALSDSGINLNLFDDELINEIIGNYDFMYQLIELSNQSKFKPYIIERLVELDKSWDLDMLDVLSDWNCVKELLEIYEYLSEIIDNRISPADGIYKKCTINFLEDTYSLFELHMLKNTFKIDCQ